MQYAGGDNGCDVSRMWLLCVCACVLVDETGRIWLVLLFGWDAYTIPIKEERLGLGLWEGGRGDGEGERTDWVLGVSNEVKYSSRAIGPFFRILSQVPRSVSSIWVGNLMRAGE